MAASGSTPISLYYTSTASNVPLAANLIPGELAINTNDGKLFYKDSSGTVQVIATKAVANGVLGTPTSLTLTNATGLPVAGISATGTASSSTYLRGDGSWAVVNSLPTQTGNSGKYLTTDGSAASWTTVNALPTQTGNSGKYLTTDGTTATWATVAGGGGSAAYTRTNTTATAGQTSFSASYNVGYVQVYLNGVLLDPSDYTATNGSTVVLGVAASAGDLVTTVALTVASVSSAAYTRVSFTATAAQTTFTTPYSAGFVQVYANGVLLNAADYTATNGTSIVLASGRTAGDIVEVVAYTLTSVGSLSGVSGTLAVANGGTGVTTSTGTGANVLATAPTLTGIKETATVSATAATGTVNFDCSTQAVLYYTTNASGNFTINFRGNATTTLNTLMAVGESMSVTFMNTNGATAYYNSAVTVDGTSVTPKWQGGTAPTSGNASAIDSYTYVIFKTAASTYTIIASVTKFA